MRVAAVPSSSPNVGAPAGSSSVSAEVTDFSLVQGGPLFQLFLRARLLQLPTGLLTRRIAVITLLAWLPPFLFSILEGRALTGAAVPFLLDIGMQCRFLLCVPLLIASEVIVHRRIAVIVEQFTERGIVRADALPSFHECIASAMRLRNSAVAEVLLLALATVGGYWVGKYYVDMPLKTWFDDPTSGSSQRTIAGNWYHFVSLPIFRILLLRWCFRFFIWFRFLWQVSRRVPLQLNALHPDQAAGLGFLSGSMMAFLPVLLAHTIGMSGILLGKIWYQGARLTQFEVEILGWVVCLTLMVLAPLHCFVVQLAEAKRAASREYGLLASRYVSDFHRKWIQAPPASNELLGAGDIQSLADLGNSYQVMRETRFVPFNRPAVVRFALLIALPFAPLTLTMIPLEQLIDRALQVLL